MKGGCQLFFSICYACIAQFSACFLYTKPQNCGAILGQYTITGLDWWTDIFCIKNHFYALKADSLACNALHSCVMRYNNPITQPSPCTDSEQVIRWHA